MMDNSKTKIKQVLHTSKSWSREFPGGPVVRTCVSLPRPEFSS